MLDPKVYPILSKAAALPEEERAAFIAGLSEEDRNRAACETAMLLEILENAFRPFIEAIVGMANVIAPKLQEFFDNLTKEAKDEIEKNGGA